MIYVLKQFQIVLDSNSPDSFTGGSYTNANYYIDLTKVIRNTEDYNKPYCVYCTFISEADTETITNISSKNLYTLSLSFSKKSNNIYQYVNNNLYSFIIPVQVQASDDSGQPDPHINFFLQDKDQRPLYIDNLYNINNIVINVLQNGNFCTATAFYVCILTFVEV